MNFTIAMFMKEPTLPKRPAGWAVGTSRGNALRAFAMLALHAALLGRTEAASLLIDAGAEVNPRSADGSTPLHTAAFFGRAETAELLLEAGADTAARNHYGQTPLQVMGTDWKTTQFVLVFSHRVVLGGRNQINTGTSRGR